jgi:hypothetical protein
MQKTVEHQPEDCCCGAILGKGHIVVLGEEHSAQKLIHSVDFWLYYTAYFCGVTVGLVYSNNLGQIAQSLHQQSRLTMLLPSTHPAPSLVVFSLRSPTFFTGLSYFTYIHIYFWRDRKEVKGGHCQVTWRKVCILELGGLIISSLKESGWALRMRWL